MYIPLSTERSLALILTAILLIRQFYLPVVAIPFYLDDSIHPADSLADDKNHSVPVQLAAVPGSAVDELTRKVLGKELELERLNTIFRQQTMLTNPWRQRRLFAYGETNSSLTLAGLILAMPPQYQVASEKTRPSIKSGTIIKPHSSPSQRNNLRAAARLPLIGNSIGTGGDLLELGLNFVNYCSLRKKGLNPSAYRKRVHKLHAEIDNLIEQRRMALTAVADFSGEDRTVAEAEGKLLRDLRDLYLLEYVDYHSGCKKFWLVQNGAYLTDLAKNMTGGAGNILGLEGYHVRRANLFGAGGLLTLISGVIILITPAVGRVTGNISGLTARDIVSQEAADVHTSTIGAYSADYRQFLAINDNRSTSTDYGRAVSNRRSLYADQEKIMFMRNQYLKKEQKEARGTFFENVVYAGIVGPTKMTNGLMGMIAGWHYPQSASTAAKFYAAGSTTYTAGVSFSVLETARLWVVFEGSSWKLRHSDMLPSNHYKTRLLLLDNMDTLLKQIPVH